MKVTMSFEVTNVRYDYGGRCASGVLLVFPENEDRPILHGKIEEDFAWRRQVDYSGIAKNTLFQKFILQVLKEEFKREFTREEVSFRFDRKAGCRMCPCSPGIVVKSKISPNTTHLPYIYVKVNELLENEKITE
jgi:hypothetical protein